MSLLLCAALLANALAVPASALDSEPAGDVPAHDGYLVKLSGGSVPMMLDADVQYVEDGNFLVVEDRAQAEEIPPEYVEYIEPNYYIELLDTVVDDAAPDDSYYTNQWNLSEIGAMTAYNRGLRGAGVKVAFIDSGINKTHEDLNSANITGKNFNSDGLQYDEDVYGHGTFAAGILAAQTNNGKGLAGVAPDAEIMAYRVFNQKTTTLSAVVQAINAAVDDGCDVMNLSLGISGSSPTALAEAIDRAAAAGVIMVAAAGNGGAATMQYPAGYTDVIGVGSVDRDLTVSSFSQRNSSVYVTAPGGGVVSLGNTADDAYMLNMTLSSNKGTSFAAPVVTGMAAIARGYDDDITEQGIRYLLESTSLDRGTAGYDNQYGYGVVNVDAFVKELQRAYTIDYRLNDGTLPEQAAQTYQVTDGTCTLPEPTRDGYVFAGWYETSDLSGARVTTIPAGSVGDRTLFAAWQSNDATDVAEVVVNGQTAIRQADGSYLAYQPYGTDLSALTSNQVIVTPTVATSIADQITTADAGATWSFTVRAAGAAGLSKQYTLRLAVMPLHVAQGAETQTGQATPPSYDSVIPAVSYTVDAASWFRDGENTVLPADTVCVAETRNGTGNVQVSGTRVTYTPALADANRIVTLKIAAQSGGMTTLDAVSVALAVGAPPPGTAAALSSAVEFDRYTAKQAAIPLALVGNTITGVTVDQTALTAEDYTLSEVSTDGTAQLLLNTALTDGVHTVTVAFAAGDPVAVTLTVKDSAPHYKVTFVSQGSTYSTSSEVREGGTVALPAAPTQSGYTFGGWYTAQNGAGSAFTAQTAVTGNLTVYAKWNAAGGGAAGGGGGGGGGGVTTPVLPATEVNTMTDSQGTTTLTLKSAKITTEESTALVEKNSKNAVLVTGEGLKITVPAGTLPAGFDVNRLVPDLSRATGANGQVLAYVDEQYVLHVLPWGVVQKGSVTFTANHAATYQIVNGGLSFNDVADGDWFDGAVAFVTARGLFTGTSSTSFSPDGTMTRAMLVTTLHRLASGNPASLETAAPITFADISQDSWYSDAVQWAGGSGLVSGMGDGMFYPGNSVTREQIAVILYNFSGKPAVSTQKLEFADAADASDWALTALRWAANQGLLAGKDGNRLDPGGNATRAEVAAILQRLICMK